MFCIICFYQETFLNLPLIFFLLAFINYIMVPSKLLMVKRVGDSIDLPTEA